MRRAAPRRARARSPRREAAPERLRRPHPLDQEQRNRLQRDLQDAMRRVERLQQEQQGVGSEVRQAPRRAARRAPAPAAEERKDAQAGEVSGLEQQLDRTASDPGASTRGRARRRRPPTIRDPKLKEKIQVL